MPSPGAALLLALAALPQPQRFASEVEDAYALRVNPAGLAFTRGSELRLLYGHDQLAAGRGEGRETANGLGLFGALRVFDAFTLGAGWERDWFRGDDRGAAYLGAGWGKGPIAFGATYRRLDFRGGGDEDLFDLGVALRPFGWLAAGVRVADVGESLGRRAWDLSLATRPGWNRLLVAGTWRLVEHRRLERESLELAARVEVEALPGLRVGAGTNQDLDLFLQLGLDFGRLSVGGFAHVVDDQAQAGGELVVRTTPANSLVTPGKVAVLELSGDLVPDPELDLLRREMQVTPYGRVPATISALAEAEGVAGVQLRIASLSIGWAKAEELRRAIDRVRAAGRRVDCHLEGGGDLTYYVASACTAITVSPPAYLQIDGLQSTQLYLGEALGKIGIEVEVERIGAYKTAPDQLSKGAMSPEEREQLDRWLDVVAGEAVTTIAESRGLSEDRVRALIDRAVLTATGAEAAGLVDAVVYPDELEDRITAIYGGRPRFARAESFLRPPSPRPWRRPDAIALVHVDAPLTGGESSASPLGLGRTVGAQTLIRALERARRDPRVVAVLLRVDSPGGDAVAADLVARAVAQVADRKPVVASFGDVAASGGYYVAAPARRIFAESTSLTGSIGVFSLALDLSDLLRRLGVGVEVLTRGDLAGEDNPFTGRSPAGDAAVRRALGAAYRRFVETVASGRGMAVGEVEQVARGQVFAGQDAVEAGLVDELGGLREAARHAAELAGRDLDALEVVTFPDPYQPIGEPFTSLAAAFGWSPPERPVWVEALVGSLGPELGSRFPVLVTEAPLALLPVLMQVE